MVGGRYGAAARLGVKRTTLIDKMRRWGLSREVIRNPEGESATDRESLVGEVLSATARNDGDVFTDDNFCLSKESSHLPPPAEESFQCGADREEERKTILAALKETKGRVSGQNGAAAKLGVAPSTLEHRIKALKISKVQFKYP